MVAKKLSSYLKNKFKPEIEDRDGKACFYCDEMFQSKLSSILSGGDQNPQEFDHLDNDDKNNIVENLVLAHRLCNRRKSSVNEWIIKAKNKLRDNLRSASLPVSHAGTNKETATETDTNAIFNDITQKELAKYLRPNVEKPPLRESLPCKELYDHLTAKGIKECGHGSQNTFRRIVDTFATHEMGYIIEKDELKKSIIRLRTEDDKDIFQLEEN